VGCSGWSYDGWRGTVYPESLPRSRWFTRYAELFDTVELNTTFYRMPALSTVQGWADAAPEGFLYATKLGQFCTHRMKLRDPAGWLPNHVERVRALSASAGPTVAQLPPRWRPDVGRLDEFLACWPADLRCAVELRDPRWLCDEVYETLARHGAALCIHDLIADHPVVLTADWTYLRFHGPAAPATPYHGRYGRRRLAPMAELLSSWLDAGHDLHAYFNNDVGGAAVADARWLAEALGVAVPDARTAHRVA
jgi:uncharacterized protein YecE (DUF72 family)